MTKRKWGKISAKSSICGKLASESFEPADVSVRSRLRLSLPRSPVESGSRPPLPCL